MELSSRECKRRQDEATTANFETNLINFPKLKKKALKLTIPRMKE